VKNESNHKKLATTSKKIDIGEDEKKAIRRVAIQNMKRSPDEEEQVQVILQNPELQAILADEAMQNILLQCQKPGALIHFMKHEVYGPKIRKLADVGLVQLHP